LSQSRDVILKHGCDVIPFVLTWTLFRLFFTSLFLSFELSAVAD